jgi:hypothetical protein
MYPGRLLFMFCLVSIFNFLIHQPPVMEIFIFADCKFRMIYTVITIYMIPVRVFRF